MSGGLQAYRFQQMDPADTDQGGRQPVLLRVWKYRTVDNILQVKSTRMPDAGKFFYIFSQSIPVCRNRAAKKIVQLRLLSDQIFCRS
jgi:hypothetical protein